MSPPGHLLSDAELLAALVDYEAGLPADVIALLPIPTHRGERPVWAVLAATFSEGVNGERIGPVHGVRVIEAADGAVHDEPYAGPAVSPTAGPVGSSRLRLRLRQEITHAAVDFFAGTPVRGGWMRVAIREAYPGDLILALGAVAPDFLAWLADNPADRA